MLRPVQITLGTLVLCCKEPAETFAEVSEAAFAEQKIAIQGIEMTLRSAPFGAKKMNYIMLMMKDPQVHYHVIPRYLEQRIFDGVCFNDATGPPVLDSNPELSLHTFQKLQQSLLGNWKTGRSKI